MTAIIEEFLESRRATRMLSPKTITCYRADLAHLRNAFQDEFPNLHASHLRNYFLDLQVKGYKLTTLRRRRTAIFLFMGWLSEMGIVADANRTWLGPFPPAHRRVPRALTRKELQRLLEAAEMLALAARSSSGLRRAVALRNRAIIEVLACAGLRVEELSRLDVCDVYELPPALRIQGKGNRERMVPLLPQESERALRGCIRARAALHPSVGAVFLNRFGGRLSTQGIRQVVDRTRRVAALERRVTPHSLRHTFATLLVENGADLRATQELLGHSSLRMTEMYLWSSTQRHQVVVAKHGPRTGIGDRLIQR